MVPLDMAAAGLKVLTTTYEGKTQEALAGISPLIQGVKADPLAIANGLIELCKTNIAARDTIHIEGFPTKWNFDVDWITKLP
jgi:hypothetical protein